jgi:flagellar biosynthetic protein FlhB
MAEAEDRTEAASPRRLEKARAEGSVALSRELPALAVLGATLLVLMLDGPQLTTRLAQRLGVLLEQADRLDPAAALRAAGAEGLRALAPVALAALLAGSAAVLLQTGFLFSLKALTPDLARLSPKRGLARLFGAAGLLEAAKSLVKVTVVGWAGWTALAGALPQLRDAVGWTAPQLAGHTLRLVVRLVLAMLAAQAAIAVLDMLATRLRHAGSLRMSRQEQRDEHREAEGDPHIKARIRRLRTQRARRRMMAAVPKATVVITNPTHYAVALSYADGQGAPRIVAKGVDELAGRIRALAQAHGVPLVANPPLARALYPLDLDREVPAEHYRAVAEIIAYVWRLRRRVAGATAP